MNELQVPTESDVGRRVRYTREGIGFDSCQWLTGTLVAVNPQGEDAYDWVPPLLDWIVEWDDGKTRRHFRRYLELLPA